MSKPQTVIFKTLMEFCPSDENLELAVRAIARKKRVITADDLHQLDFAVEELGRERQVYGAVLAKLVREGFLKKGNYVASGRRECHHRPVLEFHYVEGT